MTPVSASRWRHTFPLSRAAFSQCLQLAFLTVFFDSTFFRFFGFGPLCVHCRLDFPDSISFPRTCFLLDSLAPGRKRRTDLRYDAVNVAFFFSTLFVGNSPSEAADVLFRIRDSALFLVSLVFFWTALELAFCPLRYLFAFQIFLAEDPLGHARMSQSCGSHSFVASWVISALLRRFLFKSVEVVCPQSTTSFSPCFPHIQQFVATRLLVILSCFPLCRSP